MPRSVPFTESFISIFQMVCTFLRFMVTGGALSYAAPQHQRFLRSGDGSSRSVDASELESSLRESLEGAMGSGTWAHRAAEIERKMSKTFQALPKNEYGRLAPPQLFGTLFTIIFRKKMVGSSKVLSQLGLEQMFPSSILRTSSKTRLLRFLKLSWRIDKTGVVWACLMQLQ